MNWKNLVEEKCPKCNSKLVYIKKADLYMCSNDSTKEHCSFSTYTRNFKHLTRLFKKEGKYSHEIENVSYFKKPETLYMEATGRDVSDYYLMTA